MSPKELQERIINLFDNSSLKSFNFEINNELMDTTQVGDQWRSLAPTGKRTVSITLEFEE